MALAQGLEWNQYYRHPVSKEEESLTAYLVRRVKDIFPFFWFFHNPLRFEFLIRVMKAIDISDIFFIFIYLFIYFR